MTFPFQDPSLDIETRISDLLSRMTSEEKQACLNTCPDVPRLGVKGTHQCEGLHGFARGGPAKWGWKWPIPTTTFPQAVGLGQTWDPALIKRVADAQATETRYAANTGRHGPSMLVVRAPNADLARDPRWGRIEESYGEDPHHTGAMTAAYAQGLQGDHPRYWKCASLLKHFVANTNENNRAGTSSDMSERQLHEYHGAGFRAAITVGGARCMMAAYNAVNGLPMTQHPMLQVLARDTWGVDGIICSDGGGMHQTVDSGKHFPNYQTAAVAAVKAGIGQFLENHQPYIADALANGRLAEADLDAVLRHTFRVMIRLGQLDPVEDNPHAQIGTRGEPEPWQEQPHKDLALEATRKSIVLLKNDGLLPIDVEQCQSIAVIGRFANEVVFDWYSGTPPYAVTALQGIRDYVAKAGKLRRDRGHTEQNTIGAPDTALAARQQRGGTVVFHDGVDVDAAADVARLADLVIVVVGNHPWGDAGWAEVTHPSYGREAVDRESIHLEDERLVKKCRWANGNTIVVLQSSFPYAITWSQQHIRSIVHLTHCSQETGTALAEVLFGAVNPAGRLVHTWPKHMEHLPPMLDYDITHGRTYQYFTHEPLYPFGHGLSYSRFDYGPIGLSAPTLSQGGTVTVSATITNAGNRDGDEVVQLYASFPGSAISRPKRKLVAFRRIPVPAGATVTVELNLPASELAYYDEQRRDWTLEPGTVELALGASSADLRQTAVLHAR